MADRKLPRIIYPHGGDIPRIRREIVDTMYTDPRGKTPPPRRPSAHVLTLLGLNADGPTYTFECRESARDLGKVCTPWVMCDCAKVPGTGEPPFDPLLPPVSAPCETSVSGRHELRQGYTWRPVYGCNYTHADAEDFDQGVRRMISAHSLIRGVYFVEVKSAFTDEVELELLAEMGTRVGSIPAAPVELTARPTTAMRYPGFGPEVDLRELIEESLADDPNALAWDDDEMTVTVDAQEAAKKVVAWIEEAYDVPPDQLSFTSLPSRVHKPDDLRRHGVISLPTRGGVL